LSIISNAVRSTDTSRIALPTVSDTGWFCFLSATSSARGAGRPVLAGSRANSKILGLSHPGPSSPIRRINVVVPAGAGCEGVCKPIEDAVAGLRAGSVLATWLTSRSGPPDFEAAVSEIAPEPFRG
jgi:hypothetical protein